MIKFNELRIHPEKNMLIIDAEIIDDPALEDVYIDAIYLDTQNTFVDDKYPSEKAIEIYPNLHNLVIRSIVNNIRTTTEGKIRIAETDNTINNKRVYIEYTDEELGLDFTKDLLFVYVVPKGNVTEDTTYSMGNKLGVAINFYPIYNTLLCNLKEIHKACSVPVNAINNLIQLKAVETWVKTERYYELAKYWNRFFLNINKCSCHEHI